MDAWQTLRQFTQARIAQGRSGHGITTAALLDFQLAHAAARDAVLTDWDINATEAAMQRTGLLARRLETQAHDRKDYLLSPRRGRTLNEKSRQGLEPLRNPPVDIALILTNGLSSTAVMAHGVDLVLAVTNVLRDRGFSMSPLFLVPNARVALADEIGSLLGASLSVIIVGERPGLSAADSLGIYFTHAPAPGRTDADRNCLSNIRPPQGLTYRTAALKLAYLIDKSMQLGYSGVHLKDDMPEDLLPTGQSHDLLTTDCSARDHDYFGEDT